MAKKSIMKDKRTVHKRVHMEITIDLLVETLAKLTNSSYQQALEAALLYGVAYINQRNKLELMKWVDEIKLPTLKDVEDIIG